MKHFVKFSLLALFLSQAAYSQTPSTNDSAQQIVQRMLNTYATCSTYEDKGDVKTLFITRDRKWTDEKPFSTAFVRGGDFRYEFKHRYSRDDEWKVYIISKQESAIQNYWTIKNPRVFTIDSLAMAIGAATGVSNLSAYT